MGTYVLLSIVPVAIVGLWALLTFNGFIFKRNRCRTAWSSIDVHLKKRHDLIPNIVAAVKGYMKHEAEVLERVTRLRERARRMAPDDADRVAVERDIGSCLAAINVRVEAYPQLKASEHFLHLQRTLTEVEEQISAARRAYNAAVEAFNNAVEMFPSRLIAGLMRLRTMAFFEAVEADRVAVPVRIAER